MTLKGKRKALANNAGAQIAAIKAAWNGIIPTQPQHRKYPAAAWKDGDMFYIAKLILGTLSVRTSGEVPQTTTLVRNADLVSSQLSRIYHRRISVHDLKCAMSGPVPVPTLEASQDAAICWIKDANKIRLTIGNSIGADGPITWQYCVVKPDGIRSGTCQSKPRLQEDSTGPLIQVGNVNGCIALLRTAFKLDVEKDEITESFDKVVKVPRIVRVDKQRK
jgi:hypothetical protein